MTTSLPTPAGPLCRSSASRLCGSRMSTVRNVHLMCISILYIYMCVCVCVCVCVYRERGGESMGAGGKRGR